MPPRPPPLRFPSLLLLLSLPHAAASDCDSLRCLLRGSLLWTSPTAGQLRLSFAANQSSAAGAFAPPAAAEARVSARVIWGAGEREALLRWRAHDASYSALLLLADADRLLLHDGDGALHHLLLATAPPPPSPLPPPSPASPSPASPPPASPPASPAPDSSPPGALAPSSPSASPLGSPGAIVTLHADGGCLAANGTAAHLAPCDSPAAAWELLRGLHPSERALRSAAADGCLARRCYRGGAQPLSLQPCGACGAARWRLDGGRLLQHSLASPRRAFCVAAGAGGDLSTAPCDAAGALRLAARPLRLEVEAPERTPGLLDDFLAAVSEAHGERAAAMAASLHAARSNQTDLELRAQLEVARLQQELSLAAARAASLASQRDASLASSRQCNASLADASSRLALHSSQRDEALHAHAAVAQQLLESEEAAAAAAVAAAAAREAREACARRAAAAAAEGSEAAARAEGEATARRGAEEKAAAAAAARERCEAAAEAAAAEAEERRKAAKEAAAAVAKERARAAKCEARVESEWEEQARCKKAIDDLAKAEQRVASLTKRAEELKQSSAAARAQVVEWEDLKQRSAKCDANEMELTKELTKLRAAQSELTRRANSLEASTAAAQSEAGLAEERARQRQAAVHACEESRAASLAAAAAASDEADALRSRNASLTAQLAELLAHVGASPASLEGRARRLADTAAATLRADARVVAFWARELRAALEAAVKLKTGFEWSDVLHQAEARYRAFLLALQSCPAAPPSTDLPTPARPALYCVLSLLLALLLALRRARCARLRAEAAAAQLAEARAELAAAKAYHLEVIAMLKGAKGNGDWEGEFGQAYEAEAE
ncbi:hypothetical protein AB1Y20_016215 [Prymnesium parvum]|uniref:Uncharacterized protein n=1 Tax=Prymnesium parvum TaxID=97485 RepID=A0AB34ICN8_PRYPA